MSMIPTAGEVRSAALYEINAGLVGACTFCRVHRSKKFAASSLRKSLVADLASRMRPPALLERGNCRSSSVHAVEPIW